MMRNNQASRWTRIIAAICAGVLSLMIMGSVQGGPGQAFELRIGHQTANDYQDEFTNFFVREVGRLSNGRIKGTVFNAGQLGNPAQQNQAVRTGTQQGIVQPAGIMTSYLPELGVLDLPFLFPDDVAQTRVLNGPGGDPLRVLAEQQRVVIVAFVAGGAKDFVTRFPFRVLEDLRGRKMRVIESPELVAQMRAWGAIGIPMPFPEVYTALQQGAIDGLDNAPDTIWTAKFWEVARHVTITGHGRWSTVVAVGKQWFDSLPDDLKVAVRQAGQNTTTEALKRRDWWALQAREGMRKAGVTVARLPVPELARMKELGTAVWDDVRRNPRKAAILQSIEEGLRR